MKHKRRVFVATFAALGILVWPPSAMSESDGDFFFIHVSDVHAYTHSSEVIEHYGFGPSWVPKAVLAFFVVRRFEPTLVPRYSDGLIGPMRRAVGIAEGQESWIEAVDAAAYFSELLRPGSSLGSAATALRASFAEIGALAPAFVVNTGDIVFDAGTVPPAISEGWAELYLDASRGAGVTVHPTIGNHDVGYIERDDANASDTRYGAGFFRTHFGPNVYAFDRGEFRFLATDSHSDVGAGEGWRRNRMAPEVVDWLEAELEASTDKVAVLMNHEPFFEDPDWGKGGDFSRLEQVDADALLARHGVDYTLTGHVHLPGVGQSGSTTHIATGGLSGMHWLLPPDAAPRGYRLLYAKGRSLYSAWKRTGEPAVGFVCPRLDPDLSAVCGRGSESAADQIVAVAADSAGPFESVTLELNGRALPLEAWGAYFVRTSLPKAAEGELYLRATRGSGEAIEVRALIGPTGSSVVR